MIRSRTTLFFALLVAILFGIPFLTSSLHAKPGAVVTEDGMAYIGDVTEVDDQYVVRSGDNNTQINKQNAKKVTFFDTFKQEFEYRLKTLAADDAAGRAQLATMALEHKEDDLAAQAANAAIKIDPNNTSAKGTLETIKKKTPAPVDPVKPPVAPPAASGTRKISGKTRLVTPEEINRIRQIEWRHDDANVRVKVDPEARSVFLAKGGVKAADFNRLTPVEQGRIILDKGTKDARKGVHILTDPPTMQEYKTRVQKVLVQNCTANCHDGSNKKTSFVLHIPDEKSKEAEEAATYSNFLILQDYTTTINKVQHDMIDRATPTESVLLQYILAPSATELPHPKVEGFKGAFKTAADPRYRTIVSWVQSLPVIEPDYNVDLMKPAKEGKAPAKEGAAEAPPEAPQATPNRR